MTPMDVVCFLLLSGITGSGFTFVKYAKESFGPFTQATLRLILGTVILFTILGWKAATSGEFRSDLRSTTGFMFTLKVFVVSFFNVSVAYAVYPIAEDGLNVGVVAIIIASSPLFSVLFTRIMVKGSRISALRLLGVFVGLAGIVLVSIHPLLQHSDDHAPDGKKKRKPIYDVLITVGAAASKAIAAVLGHLWLSKNHPTTIASLQALWGLIVCGAVALIFERHGLFNDWKHATRNAWIGIGYLGTANSSAAFLLQFYLLARIGPVRQKMVAFLGPIFALIEGIILFKDWSHATALTISTQVSGSILILISIYIVNKKPEPKKKVAMPAAVNDLTGTTQDFAQGLLINEDEGYSTTENRNVVVPSQQRLRERLYSDYYCSDAIDPALLLEDAGLQPSSSGIEYMTTVVDSLAYRPRGFGGGTIDPNDNRNFYTTM